MSDKHEKDKPEESVEDLQKKIDELEAKKRLVTHPHQEYPKAIEVPLEPTSKEPKAKTQTIIVNSKEEEEAAKKAHAEDAKAEPHKK